MKTDFSMNCIQYTLFHFNWSKKRRTNYCIRSCIGCIEWKSNPTRECEERIENYWRAMLDFQRRQWHSTPVLLPGKPHGWRSLVRLQSTESLRVRHEWATSLSLFAFMHWKRKWQPTPVFLPGESQGWQSLVAWHLWGCTESDTTEVT